MKRFSGILLTLIGLSFLGSSMIGAQNDSTTDKNSRSSRNGSAQKKNPQKISMTPARQAAALMFAELHHPELSDLLAHLKKRNRPEYKIAIRELFLTSEKLARTKERWPEKYHLDLEAWKLDSRIRLMLAHIMVRNSTLDTQLEEILLKRVDVQIQQLTLQRDRLTQQQERLAERVGKLNAGISRIESDREAAARKALSRIKRSLKSRKSKKTQKRGTPVK